MTKHVYEKHRVYDGRNVTHRENDAPDNEACDHKSSQGSLFKSKFCPNCGAQIWKRADEDDDKAQERATFNAAKRAALRGKAVK